MISRPFNTIKPMALAITSLILWGQTALKADTTVVTHVSVGQTDENGDALILPSEYSATTYFKGNFERFQSENSPIVKIYDGDKSKVSVLDSSKKTFFQMSVKDYFKAKSKEPGSDQNFQIDSTFEKTDYKDTLQNAPAYKVSVFGLISSPLPERQIPQGAPGGGGGGFPHFGNGGLYQMQPGGPGDSPDGSKQGPGSMGAAASLKINYAGEIWVSDSIKLPAFKHATSLPLVEAMLKDCNPVIPDLTKQLDKLHSIPLKTMFKVDIARKSRNGDDDSQSTTKTTTIKTELTSISSDPINDGLFTIPADYLQTAPPK